MTDAPNSARRAIRNCAKVAILLPLAGMMALGAATPAMSAQQAAESPPSSQREVECLALTMYFEARSDGDAGKIAVGHVVLNRTQHERFPDTVCGVVTQSESRRSCQFSWWCDGLSDRPRESEAWSRSRELASNVYHGLTRDPTEGALYFHATDVRPAWAETMRRSKRIGRHVFYKPKEASREVSRREPRLPGGQIAQAPQPTPAAELGPERQIDRGPLTTQPPRGEPGTAFPH